MSGTTNYIKEDKYGIRDRFKGAEYMNLLVVQDMTVVGAGGIGSPQLLNLAKAGSGDIYLYEMDTVGGHNLGGQSFFLKDVNTPKEKAIRKHMKRAADYDSCHPMGEFFEGVSEVSPVVMMCVDNNKVRKMAFDTWYAMAEENDWMYTIQVGNVTLNMPFIFIDGRLSFASYDTFYVNRMTAHIYRDNFLEIRDSPLVPGCTTKSNVHVGQLTAGDMFQLYINHLQNCIDFNDGFENPANATPFNVKRLLHYNKTYTDVYGIDPIAKQLLYK